LLMQDIIGGRFGKRDKVAATPGPFFSSGWCYSGSKWTGEEKALIRGRGKCNRGNGNAGPTRKGEKRDEWEKLGGRRESRVKKEARGEGKGGRKARRALCGMDASHINGGGERGKLFGGPWSC